jgi:RNA polymerase-binding transcription factor DksA
MPKLRVENQATRVAQSTVVQILKEKNSTDADDTATTLSAMTADTAVQDQQQQRIDDLEALLQSTRMGGGNCNNTGSGYNNNTGSSNSSTSGGN